LVERTAFVTDDPDAVLERLVDQAFDVLRVASQHTHRKVRDIATEVADTGASPILPNRREPDR
jgi:hypothetical protein